MATSAAGDDTADRAQLHPRIVGGVAGAVYSPAAPTLLLWGADDRVIPQRLIHEVKTAHPSWSSRTIDGVGHLLPWESPELYVELAG